MIKKILYEIISKTLSLFGYSLKKSGLGYIDAKTTVKNAQKAGLSICDYREKELFEQTGQELRLGRTERIISRIDDVVNLETCSHICEIGTGTGMYLEKILQLRYANRYENYETDIGWKNYLKNTYKDDSGVLIYDADGKSLQQTASESCDLVHAHAVFVYLPLLLSLEYLHEAVRVCKNGGYIVFDAFIDDSFDYKSAKTWINGIHRFPVILPQKILSGFISENNLELIETFDEIYGSTVSNYLVLRKNS